MAVIEAVSRLLPGVLGNPESLAQESHVQEGAAEYPQYTRPELFRRLKVPKILLSGDHKRSVSGAQKDCKKMTPICR